MNYTPDHRGIRKLLQTSPQLKATLMKKAYMGLGVAAGLADRRTGELAASGEVRDDGPNGGVNNDRMQVSIHFTARHAVPHTFPKRAPDNRDYLEAAIPVIEHR